MGKLLKRIQVRKVEKKKVSFMISQETLKKLEKLQEQVGYRNKSEFIEKLLEYALEELERELKRSQVRAKVEEKQEEIKEESTVQSLTPKFQSDSLY